MLTVNGDDWLGGVGVGVAVGPGVAVSNGVGVGKAAAAVEETSTPTDRSLSMTTVACLSRLPSTAVQATDPGAETTKVTMVPCG